MLSNESLCLFAGIYFIEPVAYYYLWFYARDFPIIYDDVIFNLLPLRARLQPFVLLCWRNHKVNFAAVDGDDDDYDALYYY